MSTMEASMLYTLRHVMKLDPAKEISDKDLQHLIDAGTDAIIVGGTDEVTYENTHRLFSRLPVGEIPILQEISTLEAILPTFDRYLIPSILTTTDIRWMVGEHLEAIKRFGDFLPWDRLWLEGYVVGNPEAKVAKKTSCLTDLLAEDVTAYARLTEHLFQFPIFYVEYSGTYGGTEWLRAARKGLEKTILFYGGGVREEGQAREVATYADVVVIGNLIYEDVQHACETVQWVKTTEKVRGK